MIEKFEFYGKNDGIKLLILGAIHGNEVAGPEAINKLINELKNKNIQLTNGKLTVVPVCNPKANQKDLRCIDENLNRVITPHKNPQTYEQQLANQICPLIKSHDVLLDLHSTHCKEDTPFAFCDYPNEYNQKLIASLPVDYVLEGWPNIYASQCDINDYSTERYAHDCGNTGTTLECGYHKSTDAGNLAYQAILNTLKTFNLIDGVAPKREKKHILLQSYITKKRNGKLCKNYKHLDKVKKGEIIAKYEDGETLTAPYDCYILLPNANAEINTEWYYLGSEKL